MKKLIITSLALSVSLFADLSVSQIEKMVKTIHEKRAGVSLDILDQTKEPFIRIKEEDNVTTVILPTDTAEEKISLHAIMNGKAYINDAWFGIDESIMGYDLKYIGKRGVVLRNGNHIKKLFLHEEKDNFIKIEGR